MCITEYNLIQALWQGKEESDWVKVYSTAKKVVEYKRNSSNPTII